MIKLIFLCSLIIVAVQGNCGACPKAPRFYEELNCSGVMVTQGDCCAVRYDCPDLTIEDLQHKDPSPIMAEKRSKFHKKYLMKLGVASVNAPVLMILKPAVFFCDPFICSGVGSLEEGFSWSYSPSQCCITGVLLDVGRPALHKCSYRGINTVKGEKFTPPEDTCYKLDCGVPHFRREEIKASCAPVYKEERSCCPFDWICRK